MRGRIIVGTVGLVSLLMVGASIGWVALAGGATAWASFAVALLSFFFNLSGAAYLAEGEALDRNVRRVEKGGGKVAVAVPVCNPDFGVLEKCIRSIKRLEWPGGFSLSVLDDTGEKGHAERVGELCGKLGVEYIHRGTQKGGKGGALNSFLHKTEAEFLAVLDGDEVVRDRKFLVECMGHFGRKEVAFVQSNKECGGKGLFARAANYTNAAFVNLIQPINSRKGVALFTGSCGVFRVSALRDVGGFPDSLIEDIAVSLRLMRKGWEGEHVSKVYAVGAEVGSFGRFAGQHMRYICGLTLLLPEYFANIWKVSLEKKSILLVHALGLHYVSLVQVVACGVAVAAALGGSLPGELASLAYLFSSFAALIVLAKAYSGSVKVGAGAYFMNFSLMVPRIIASAGAVFGMRLMGRGSLFFSAGLQLALGAGLVALAIGALSPALLWWGVLFLSNPVLLAWKK